jgi:succinate dehydrogenase/fumarate reductase cytochrome b subunit
MNLSILNEEASTLDNSLAQIIEKLNELMGSVWNYVILALATGIVLWGAYVGIRIVLANKREEKINARDMIKNLIIGIIVIFVVAMGAPLLIKGLMSWVGI